MLSEILFLPESCMERLFSKDLEYKMTVVEETRSNLYDLDFDLSGCCIMWYLVVYTQLRKNMLASIFRFEMRSF